MTVNSIEIRLNKLKAKLPQLMERAIRYVKGEIKFRYGPND